MTMRKWFLSIVFSLLLTNVVYANTVFQDTQGHLIPSKSLKNKWVIINYWAEWCGPCVKEIPELNHFYQNNHDKDVVLYGVYYDALPMNDLKQVVQGAKIEFPVLSQDPHSEWQLEDVSILPTTFILNPQGVLVKTIYGGSNEDSLKEILQELKNNFANKK